MLQRRNVMVEGCPHCAAVGEDRLWESEKFRVVLVHQPGFPGWCRVIWNSHVAELTDLSAADRRAFLDAVMLVEELLRSNIQPRKINLAALATGMPHLHFHIIPRFEDDPTFPEPVWLPPVRSSDRVLPAGFSQTMRVALERRLADV
jgi:diadenosine tetraphosphate (Ap4A) HIT family hydrolase